MADNPYAAPAADVSAPPTDAAAHAESVRREHLTRETNIRSVGALYVLGGAALLLVGGIWGYAVLSGGTVNPGQDVTAAALLLLLGGAQLWNGIALRRLRPRARIPGVLLGIIALINVPVGTIIGIIILYLLLSAKGRTVLSDDYAKVRELTPHIRYRTSIVVWLLVGLVILGLIAAVAIPVLQR